MISLVDLKEHLKVDTDADDVLLVQMEQAAVQFIQNETGRYFGPVTQIIEVLSANGWASVWLQAEPITGDEYQPFQLEQRAFPNGEWAELTEGVDYEVSGGRVYPLTYLTPGRRTLRATYHAGHAEGTEPADVQQAVKELVAKMYAKRLPIVEGTIVAELPFGVTNVIRAHRVVVF